MNKAPPKECPKCKTAQPQCINSGLVDETKYVETFQCDCSHTWDNIYRYQKTKKVKAPEYGCN